MKLFYLSFLLVLQSAIAIGQCGTTVSSTAVLCFGACDGTISFTPASGTPPYSLSVNGVPVTPFAATYILNNACPGMYHWVLSDVGLTCMDSGDVAVSNATPLMTNVSATQVTCFGGNNASATVNVSGGLPPYYYSWTPTGGNAATASNLSAGIYTVAVHDSNNCWYSTNAIISQPAALVITSMAITNVSCNGGNNGSAMAVAGGGIPPYNYVWTPGGATTPTVNNLSAGNYSVTATDASGCSTIQSIAITQPSGLNLSVSSVTNANCFGANTGSICVTASGGVFPYAYTWNPSGNASTCPNNLVAGNYTCVVQDANGCFAMTNATVSEPPLFSLSIDTISNVLCYGGNNGSVTLIASGGIPPYSTTHFSGLTALTHVLTVMDASGCLATANVTITQPAFPLIIADSSITNVTCSGGSDGAGCVFVYGGTAPYSYQWTSGDTILCISNLAAADYIITATDANGCLATDTLQIEEPSFFVASISPTLSVCSYIPQQLCVNVIGGISPYSYAWNTGFATGNCNVSSPTVPTNYFVTVTDFNGCTATDILLVNPVTPVTAVIHSIPPSCGQCDGFVNIVPAGGTPAYTFEWIPPITGGICENVTYLLNVIDMNGCTDSLVLSFPSQCDSVWPGDANADGVADNFDVLSIGVNYVETGTARPGASNTWTAQVCPNWNDSLANGVNNKHSDCDGSGTVNASDTIAVSLNYGMTHLRSVPQAYQVTWPDFSLKSAVDSAGLNQVLRIKLYMGSAATPISSIYGIAFTLNFDPLLADTATAAFDFSASALGTAGVDLITFQHADFSSGKIDVTLSRTDHANVVLVDSLLAEFSIQVAGIVPSISTLHFGLSDVKAITSMEEELALNTLNDSVVINPAITGIHPVNEVPSVFVYPVPVKDRLMVKSPALIYSAGLFNELGAKVFFQEFHQKSFEIGTLDLPDGIYFLQLNTASGWITKRISLVK